MAIIPTLPGLKITLESNSRTLPEHPDIDHPSPSHNETHNYVECTSNAEFKLRYDFTSTFNFNFEGTIWMVLSVDGRDVASQRIPKSFIPKARIGNEVSTVFAEGACVRVSVGEVGVRPLRFARIERVDDVNPARVKEDVRLAKGLGEIVVKVHRTVIKYAPVNRNAKVGVERKETVTEIAEKALKGQAIDHGVSFGDATRRYSHNAESVVTFLDGVENPIATFVFKYRSREALKSEMIIPRSPSPEPERAPFGRSSGNVGISPEERIAQLERELARVKAEARIKRERDDGGVAKTGRAYKKSKKEDAKTMVDLTDD